MCVCLMKTPWVTKCKAKKKQQMKALISTKALVVDPIFLKTFVCTCINLHSVFPTMVGLSPLATFYAKEIMQKGGQD